MSENKRKQKRFLLLSLAFFYFSESGLFKGLRPIQMKNFFLSQVICDRSRLLLPLLPRPLRPRAIGAGFGRLAIT
jgi:hypothetical protein